MVLALFPYLIRLSMKLDPLVSSAKYCALVIVPETVKSPGDCHCFEILLVQGVKTDPFHKIIDILVQTSFFSLFNKLDHSAFTTPLWHPGRSGYYRLCLR